jgi:plasmid stabilization system protein ParE
MTRLRILPEVFDDAASAANWYDSKEDGLGDRFLDCLRGAYHPIRTHPQTFRCVYQDYRRVLLNPFPYAVYFRLENDSAIITLVFHTARNPARLKKLLSKRSREE